MVALPGTYPLNSPSESILSILGRAGGLKGTGDEPAAQRVVLFPASTGARQSAVSAEADSSPERRLEFRIKSLRIPGTKRRVREIRLAMILPGTDAVSSPWFAQAKTGDRESTPPGQVGAVGDANYYRSGKTEHGKLSEFAGATGRHYSGACRGSGRSVWMGKKPWAV